MTDTTPALQQLSAHGRLHELLRSASASEPTAHHLCVALRVDGETRYAALQNPNSPPEASSVRLGCLVKLFTATLVAQAVQKRELDFGTPAREVIQDERPAVDRMLKGITVRNLLNHTHGLDDAHILRPPLHPDGKLDVRSLGDQLLGARVLAAPGELYSYGNVGAWMNAAILERITHKKYAELLLQRLLAPLSAAAFSTTAVADICAADEREFSIPMGTALEFLSLHLPGGGPSEARLGFDSVLLREEPLPLPGWSRSERGVCLGWKYYGSGWYGHNAQIPGYSAAWRIHPETRTALAFSGDGERAFAAFARMFTGFLPEFSAASQPRLLEREQLDESHFAGCVGDYANSASSIAIRHSGDRSLSCRLLYRRPGPPIGDTAPFPLAAARDHLFYPQGGGCVELPFVQFNGRGSGERFEYIWNGRSLWRRTDMAGDALGVQTSGVDHPLEVEEPDLEQFMGRC